VLSTAGGLVFQGAGDGRLVAYDARSGAVAWEVSTGLGIIAPPVTYSVDGVQYVTVVAGWGGVGGRSSAPFGDAAQHEQRGRVLTFALDRTAAMPELQPARTQVVVATNTDVPTDAAVVATGGALFGLNCAICHGGSGASRGTMPNLLTAPQAVHDQFLQIVMEGSREPFGMPSFASRLSREEARSIHAFLIQAARRAAGG
jgi:mono/diheme cytochrome c family protein